MKIVIDTNILFSFFKETSITRSLILNPDFMLVSPELALEELNKYSSEISKKAKNINFKKEVENLKKIVSFKSPAEYSEHLMDAKKIIGDKDDADFVALSIKERCPLWSNDFLLKDQDKVNVLSTQDLVDLIF